MFKKLHGKRREIVEAIYDKSNEEAMTYIYDMANSCYDAMKEKGDSLTHIYDFDRALGSLAPIRGELDDLERDGFLTINWADNNVLTRLWVLPKCKDYFEMEKEYNERLQSNSTTVHVDARDNKGNVTVAGRDATNVTQTVSIGTTESDILKLITEMKNIIETLDIDKNIKDDVCDDLESMSEQINLPESERKITRVKKAWESIKSFVEVNANVATLVTACYDLAPKVAALLKAGGLGL